MMQTLPDPTPARRAALLLSYAAQVVRGEELAWTNARVLRDEYGMTEEEIAARVAALRAIVEESSDGR